MSERESSKKCPSCNSTELETDITLGMVVCIACGNVIEENLIVAEVEFEDQGTKSRAVGHFIPDEGTGLYAGGVRILTHRTSKEHSVARARRIISQIASNPLINLPSSTVEGALNFYKMSLDRGLTRARVTKYIAVACLYIVCRLNKTPHLLVDFSEVTQTDVFILGRVFQLLCREIRIYLPVVDPCLYVERYGYKLNLGEKTRDVCHTAVRLVGRMKRDWIHTGRRPSGICGAALLVASKLHGFSKSIKQVIKVVRVSSAVLLNRLKDVEKTPVSNLTVDEFFSTKLEDLMDQDPPSFKEAQKNFLRRTELEKANDWLNPEILDRVSKTNEEIETLLGIRSAIKLSLDSAQKTGNLIDVTKRKPKKIKKSKASENEESFTDSLAEMDMNRLRELAKDYEEKYAYMSKPVPLIQLETKPDDSQETKDEGFSDIDDDEINEMILTEKEVVIKKIVWYSEHGEFLRKKHENEVQKKEASTKVRKRKSTGPRKKVFGLNKQILEDLLEEEPAPVRSSKINYDVLDRLNAEDNKITSNKSNFSDKTTALMDMMLDPKRIDEVLIRKVPDHIKKKYEEKEKSSQTQLKNADVSSDRLDDSKNEESYSLDEKSQLNLNMSELCPLDQDVSEMIPYEEKIRLLGLEGYDHSEEEEYGDEFIY